MLKHSAASKTKLGVLPLFPEDSSLHMWSVNRRDVSVEKTGHATYRLGGFCQITSHPLSLSFHIFKNGDQSTQVSNVRK